MNAVRDSRLLGEDTTVEFVVKFSALNVVAMRFQEKSWDAQVSEKFLKYFFLH